LARAKHTDRTDARRRHRAAQANLATDPDGEAPVDAPAKPAPARTPAPSAMGRPSLIGSMRAAFQPLDLRGDVGAFPQVVRHWAVPVAIAVAIVATLAFIVSTNDLGASLDFSLSDPLAGKTVGSVSNLSYLVVSLFVAPPPAAGAFLIGFTAKRASWLGGLVYGIVAAVCYSAIVLSPAGRLITGGQLSGLYLVNVVGTAILGSALLASMAAWYRRFLNLANPNRGRPQQRPGSKQRPRPSTAKAGNRAR
jgi:hypothetical protein